MDDIKVHFLGASGTVTGSKYLIEYAGRRILVDCGLFQGRKELRDRNWKSLPVPPSTISAVVLTHAHLDHTGYLPKLVKDGFSGPIYCTPPTKELTKFILLDSAYLQEEEARFANLKKSSKHTPALPLYTVQDAENAIKKLTTIKKNITSEIISGISVYPLCSGHILGAVSLTFNIGKKKIVFSGDVGRYNIPILPDPVPVSHGNLFICEATYGDKIHEHNLIETQLIELIKKVSNKQGPLLIPSFAIGRSQHLLYLISKLEREKLIPELPVFIDSPMAINATEIYNQYKNDFDTEASEIIRSGYNPLNTKRCSFLRTSEESKKLNRTKGSFIVIAGSGMATGGRILHHLSRWLPYEEATVALVGYQAEETRGRKLQDGEKFLKIYGEQIQVRADVENLSGLSAHGDKEELTKWLELSSNIPEQVRLVHGEKNSLDSFSKHLNKTFKWESRPAFQNEIVTI